MRITNSMAKSFNRCKKLYDYKFVQDWVPKHAPLPMKRGTWLHDLIEAHYTKDGWRKHLEEVLKPQYDALFDEEKDMYGDLPAECARIMQAYEYHWREEDADWKIIAAEQVVEVPLPHDHTMQFRFDLIIEDEYGRWLVEHKSHKTIPGSDYRFIDIQSTRYVWGLNKLGDYGKIIGVCWNYLRTVPPGVPKINKDGTISKRKITTDLFTYMSVLRENGLDPRDYRDVLLSLKRHNPFFRRERVPRPTRVMDTLVKEMVRTADEIERGFHPVRAIDRACEWCSYKEPCLVSLYGGDEESVLKTRFQKGDAEDYYGYQKADEDE